MIEVANIGSIRQVTINRPEKAGALTESMLMQIRDAAREATHVSAFVLTGTGNVFSAGADLDAARAGLATSKVWEEVSGAIADLPGLTIAALNGTVAGGAMGMVLACDVRIATPSAKFFYPVMKLGFLPQPSDPKRMSALVGPARTKLIFAAGQKIDARQAYDFGLVDEVVVDQPVMERAVTLCADITQANPQTAGEILAMCAPS